MILELPQLAKNYHSNDFGAQNISSKPFKKYFMNFNKQVFNGPPENTREHVVAATKAVLKGDCKRAIEYILQLEVWKLLPLDGGEKVKEMLRKNIKEEAVRCYVLIHADHYESFSLKQICAMFDMEELLTRRIISRMIFNKEITAAWDNPSDILLVYKMDPTVLQTSSVILSEKLSSLLESNERILDILLGGNYGYKDDWNSRDNRKQWGNDNQRGGKSRTTGIRTSAFVAQAKNSKSGKVRNAGTGKRDWSNKSGGRGGQGKYSQQTTGGEAATTQQPRRWGTAAN